MIVLSRLLEMASPKPQGYLDHQNFPRLSLIQAGQEVGKEVRKLPAGKLSDWQRNPQGCTNTCFILESNMRSDIQPHPNKTVSSSKPHVATCFPVFPLLSESGETKGCIVWTGEQIHRGFQKSWSTENRKIHYSVPFSVPCKSALTYREVWGASNTHGKLHIHSFSASYKRALCIKPCAIQ